jgi:DNA-binding response OmpR family regulator
MATKQKILIVDDDENIAELISLYLTKECFETKIVYDGESALLQLDTFRPNLILLDLMLPGIDGYQVCREIRKSNNVPIIMLSAKGETFDKVLGLELGADDYIIKPFETKELVARVKAVLRRYQMPAESAGRCNCAVRGIPGSDYQSQQLFRAILRKDSGNAAEGTGTALLSGFFAESGLYKGTAFRPHLGL